MKKPAGKRRRGITGRWITGNLLFTFVILLIAAVCLLAAGVFNGSAKDVLGKAVNVCTECIGLG